MSEQLLLDLRTADGPPPAVGPVAVLPQLRLSFDLQAPGMGPIKRAAVLGLMLQLQRHPGLQTAEGIEWSHTDTRLTLALTEPGYVALMRSVCQIGDGKQAIIPILESEDLQPQTSDERDSWLNRTRRGWWTIYGNGPSRKRFQPDYNHQKPFRDLLRGRAGDLTSTDYPGLSTYTADGDTTPATVEQAFLASFWLLVAQFLPTKTAKRDDGKLRLLESGHWVISVPDIVDLDAAAAAWPHWMRSRPSGRAVWAVTHSREAASLCWYRPEGGVRRLEGAQGWMVYELSRAGQCATLVRAGYHVPPAEDTDDPLAYLRPRLGSALLRPLVIDNILGERPVWHGLRSALLTINTETLMEPSIGYDARAALAAIGAIAQVEQPPAENTESEDGGTKRYGLPDDASQDARDAWLMRGLARQYLRTRTEEIGDTSAPRWNSLIERTVIQIRGQAPAQFRQWFTTRFLAAAPPRSSESLIRLWEMLQSRPQDLADLLAMALLSCQRNPATGTGAGET